MRVEIRKGEVYFLSPRGVKEMKNKANQEFSDLVKNRQRLIKRGGFCTKVLLTQALETKKACNKALAQ